MNHLAEIDGVQNQIACGINTLNAIHTAMEEGKFSPKSFLDGLFFVFIHLQKESDKMRELIDQAFEEQRKGVERK